MWALMTVCKWDAFEIEADGPPPCPVLLRPPTDPAQPVGFMPVFATEEAALAWANGECELMEIEKEGGEE